MIKPLLLVPIIYQKGHPSVVVAVALGKHHQFATVPPLPWPAGPRHVNWAPACGTVSFWMPSLTEMMTKLIFQTSFSISNEPVSVEILSNPVSLKTFIWNKISVNVEYGTQDLWGTPAKQFPLCQVTAYVRWEEPFTSLGLASLSVKERLGSVRGFHPPLWDKKSRVSELS